MKRGKQPLGCPAAHLDTIIGPGLALALALIAAIASIGCEPDPSPSTEAEPASARAAPRRAEEPDASKNVTRIVLDSLARVERPHVVLIMIDTLRRDHVHAYGYPRETTPSIDALARSAIRYDRAYSQSSWTTPSTASILTGRYPSQLGVRKQTDPLPDHATLLPEILRAHGYRTGAVVSHVFISERWNFDQGYDEFDASNSRGHAAVTSASVSDAAIEFIESSFPQGPSFLLVHYFDPHFDYIEHEDFRFSEDTDYEGWVKSGMLFGDLRRKRHEMNDDDFRRLLALYDSEIAFTDHHIGRVLDAIRALGFWDESLVVLSADHGEEFMEHDKFAHGRTLYEEQIRVPLIIKWPNAKQGAVSRRLVQSIDVLPSLLDYLEVPPPPGIAGAPIQRQTRARPT